MPSAYARKSFYTRRFIIKTVGEKKYGFRIFFLKLGQSPVGKERRKTPRPATDYRESSHSSGMQCCKNSRAERVDFRKTRKKKKPTTTKTVRTLTSRGKNKNGRKIQNVTWPGPNTNERARAHQTRLRARTTTDDDGRRSNMDENDDG